MSSQIKMFCQTVTGAALAVLIAACSTPGRSSATKATSGVEAVQQRMVTGEQQLNATVESLVDLVNSPQADLRPQYNKYLDNLGKLEAQIKKGREERTAMRTQAEAYFAKWENDIQTIQNEEIKKAAQSRRDTMKASFQKINVEFSKAKPVFDVFMRDLKEIQKALDFDLTPGGITVIKPIVGKAKEEAATVKTNIATIRAELSRVSSEMAATAPSSQ